MNKMSMKQIEELVHTPFKYTLDEDLYVYTYDPEATYKPETVAAKIINGAWKVKPESLLYVALNSFKFKWKDCDITYTWDNRRRAILQGESPLALPIATNIAQELLNDGNWIETEEPQNQYNKYTFFTIRKGRKIYRLAHGEDKVEWVSDLGNVECMHWDIRKVKENFKSGDWKELPIHDLKELSFSVHNGYEILIAQKPTDVMLEVIQSGKFMPARLGL